MGNSIEQWKLVFLTISMSVSLFCGLEFDDSCKTEKDCTIQLSSSTSLHCTVGYKKDCENVQFVKNPQVYGDPELFPYLATISIYKRTEDEFDALNFSFLVPPTGISGVMTEFGEAPGYHNNSYYEEPICRFFNFSSTASSFLPETLGHRLEVPYTCIAIDIFPSVFYLNLTSVPSAHLLHYVISWHEHSLQIYEDQDGETTKLIWIEKVIAVAAVDGLNTIHAVFQPPGSSAGISSLQVSLITEFKVVMLKQVDPRESTVRFTEVPSGQYRVVLNPQGDSCTLEHNLCSDIVSEYVSIAAISEAVAESSRAEEDLPYILAPTLGVVLVLVTLGAVAAAVLRRLQWRKELGTNSIFITSMACRELEKNVTSYFCSFLSVALQTGVTFALPLLHPEYSKFITHDMSNCDEESKQRLTVQTPASHKVAKCYIILQFYYPIKRSLPHTIDTCESNNNLVVTNSCSDECCEKDSTSIGGILQRIPSKKAYIVTFMQEPDVSDAGIAYTIQDSEYGTVSDHNSVLNGTRWGLSRSHTASLCNRIDRNTDKIGIDSVKEYFLPCEIRELYEDLQSRLPSKTSYLPINDTAINKYWQITLTVFRKAAENQPCNASDVCDPVASDVFTIDETNPNSDCAVMYIKTSLSNLSLLTDNSESESDFSSSSNQNQISSSNNDPFSNGNSVHLNTAVGLCPGKSTETRKHTEDKTMLCKTSEASSQASVDESSSLSRSISSHNSYSNFKDAENDIMIQCMEQQSKTEETLSVWNSSCANEDSNSDFILPAPANNWSARTSYSVEFERSLIPPRVL